MSTRDAATALRRFGLGARPGEIARIAGDPRGFVLASLANGDAASFVDPDLDPSQVTLTATQVAGQQQQIANQMRRADAVELAQRRAQANGDLQVKGVTSSDVATTPGGLADQRMAALEKGGAKGLGQPPVKPGRVRTEAFQDEAAVRFERQVTLDAGLPERLAMFWSNHFCVSATKGNVRGIAGAFEREAIRPHVLGRFGDMLRAVEQHPAMLIFLDNQLSFGPNSQAGKNQKKGLNENLAREILELHTLGVHGGYSQDDVTNLARIITGWTVGGLNQPLAEPGKFFYAAPRHEPGDWAVAGKLYKNEGRASGEAVLADLARHPSTAKFMAQKLVTHFISEQAPPALTAKIEKVFRDSDGHLGEVTRALVRSNEAWTAAPKKMIPPADFVVSLARSLGHRPKWQELLRLSNMLGQPLWQVPSPKGWPDDDQAWAGPSGLRERLRVAEQVARQLDKSADPRLVADAVFADTMSEPTKTAIARAETREQGFELLIMSPEFQRR